MAQTINPLYGAPLRDNTFSLAIGLPHGVYMGMVPTLAASGSGWTASLSPDADGWSAWRTHGETTNGKFIVMESGAITLSIAAPDTNPRIDLIVGVHRWVEGPNDPVTLKPTGQFLDAQHATYAVIKGVPSGNPVAPVVPDPYDTSGSRAVILAQVYVPVTGLATISRWPSTDLRLDYMRLLGKDVEDARAPFSSLKTKLDSMAGNTQVQSLAFRGITPNTGAGSTFTTFLPTTSKKYGDAVTQRSESTFGLTVPGLYEVMAFQKMEGSGISGGKACSELRAYLSYNNGTKVLIDNQADTNESEVTQAVYAQVYVDSSWSDPYIYFDRAGWPDATLRGSIKYLGQPATLDALAVSTADLTLTEASGQTYPATYVHSLAAANAVGSVTWAIVSGSGKLDGTTSPAATVVNGNQIQIAWSGKPTSFPQTYAIEVQATDSAATPRTATKTITLTLYGATSSGGGTSVTPVVIGNSDFAVTPGSYPYSVQLQPIASGGTPPYVFAVVAGADTNLPSAVYDSATNTITGSVSADGTYKVRLRASDSSLTTQVVEKVVNIASTMSVSGGGGGGGSTGCVPAGTLLECVDGPVPIEQVKVGTLVRAYDEETLEMVEAMVTKVYVLEGRALASIETEHGTLKCSRDHRIWRKESRRTRSSDPHWPPVEEMFPGDRTLWEVAPGQLEEAVLLSVDLLDEEATVYHVSLDHGHIFVAGSVASHNFVKVLSD